MNHLTNLYKHKCEQLQEQIDNLTRMLNEAVPPRIPKKLPRPTGGPPVTWVNQITSLGRGANRTLKDIQTIFKNLPPDPAAWKRAWDYLSESDKALFFRLYGDIGDGSVGLMNRQFDGNNVSVRIIRDINGIAGIYYWNTSTNNWTRFPIGYTVPGVGRNAGAGINYNKEWLSALNRDIRIEALPNSTDVFSPSSPRDFEGRGYLSDRLPSTDVGGGSGQSTGSPGY